MIKKNFMKMLYQAGCSVTKRRLMLLSFLASQKNPVNIKEIMGQIDQKEIDQATVYRILNLFKEKGIVNQIDFHQDAAYFELQSPQNDHHHIICTQCKKVTDFTGCENKKIISNALQQAPEFATITNHSFELFGICKSCEN